MQNGWLVFAIQVEPPNQTHRILRQPTDPSDFKRAEHLPIWVDGLTSDFNGSKFGSTRNVL